MIKGDAGMESIYTWSEHTKRESFRGASGGGDGVHVLTGPIAVDGAEPGDVLQGRDHGSAPATPARQRERVFFSCVEIKFHGAVGARPTPGSNARAQVVGLPGPRAQGRRLELRRRRLHLHPGLERRGHHDLRELASDDQGTYATPSYAFTWPTA